MQEMSDGKDNLAYDWVEDQITWLLNNFECTKQ